METIFIILAIIGLILFFVWSTYNTLVGSRNRVKEAWADIDVQLKKRYDLLPDLIETARKAMAVDEQILTKITQLRSNAIQSASSNPDPEQRSKLEAEISSSIRDFKVQVEAYPDIKSHTELVNLMDKVTEIEEKIAYARRFFNQNVMDYNTKVEVFPSVVVANFFSFQKEKFFEATAEERLDVKVKFDNA
jgi:LemA protein